MLPFEGKTIIFGVSKFFFLNKMFESELRRLGFNTVDISIVSHDFKSRGARQKIKKFVGKRILGKEQLFLGYESCQHDLQQILDGIESVDYVLLTRPDLYPVDFVRRLRDKGGVMIGYQWDGLHKFPNIYSYIELFDRFFVFESGDLAVPGVLPITNFYPESWAAGDLLDLEFKSDVFYSGSYSPSRLEPLHIIRDQCEYLGYDFRYSLYYRRKKALKYHLSTTDKAIPYSDNLKYTFNTHVILDLLSPNQTGLSFRVFEAIGIDKKLITNNKSVRDYDFYTPENIMIWEGEDLHSLAAFLEVPLTPYPQVVKERYCFSNWIKYALDVGTYQPITLPITS